MVCRVYKPKATVAQNRRVVWAYDHSVTVGVLPVSMFANGHIFFVQKLYEVCLSRTSCALSSGHSCIAVASQPSNN